MKKYNYYDLCFVKNGIEWYYIANTMQEVIDYIQWAKDHNQEIKYIKGRVR